MTVKANYSSQLRVVETIDGDFVDPSDNTFSVSGLNTSTDLDATTTPAVSAHAEFTQALTTGAATIDLTLLPTQQAGVTVTGLNKKVICAKFRAVSTNGDPITLTAGASNGIDLLGAAWSLTLDAGDEVMVKLGASSPTIISGDRTIDLAGSNEDELECQFVLGL